MMYCLRNYKALTYTDYKRMKRVNALSGASIYDCRLEVLRDIP